MKVRCRKCKRDMEFPYYVCESCGWETRGKYREISDSFAEKYIRINGNRPELRTKLDLARKGVTEDDLEWDSEGDEPIVKCPLCSHEMAFPYIECGSCKWVARKKMRGKARDFAEDHISSNPDKEEILRIIWDEENSRLKKKTERKNKRVKGIIISKDTGKRSRINNITGFGMIIGLGMISWVLITTKYRTVGSIDWMILSSGSLLLLISLMIKNAVKKRSEKK